jgi:hypothetical protein
MGIAKNNDMEPPFVRRVESRSMSVPLAPRLSYGPPRIECRR